MGLFDWAAAINPVAFLGNALSFGGDYLLQDRQNQQNRDIMKSQQAWQEAMWKQTNEYNTPTSQVQRLRDAGLNPNLAYGQVADSRAASIGSVSSPSMGRVQAPRLFDYQQSVNMAEQNKLIRSQNALAEANATGAKIENIYKAWETKTLMNSNVTRYDAPWVKLGNRLLGVAGETLDSLKSKLDNAGVREFGRSAFGLDKPAITDRLQLFNLTSPRKN